MYIASTSRTATYTATSAVVGIDNCLFYNNACPGVGTGITGQGGAIFQTSASTAPVTTTIRHATFQANSAEQAGAIFNLAATGSPSVINLRNSILWAHTTTITTSRMFHTSHAMGTVNLNNCLANGTNLTAIFAGNGTRTGTNMIYNQNPLFVNAVTGDMRLSAGSPAINAGSAQYGLGVDLIGNTRTGNPDLGCYERTGEGARMAEPTTGSDAGFNATLFPNPTSGAFTVSFDREITGFAQVFDLQGRLVESLQLNGANQAQFDLGGQTAGAYLVRIVSGNEVVTKQVIVKKP